MAEYIEKKMAFAICGKIYQDMLKIDDYGGAIAACRISDEIKNIPAANVASVVNSTAVEGTDSVIHCAECGRVMNPHIDNYCSKCGARIYWEADNAQ